MSVDPAQVKSLFLAAADLPAAERSAFLDRECAYDSELRARVEALLHAHEPTPADVTAAFERSLATGDYQPNEATGTFGDHTRTHESGTGSEPGTTVGTVIAGRYSLVEVIGEGGMGSVYLASQSEPVKRQVALKLIKTGMDSKGVLARFDAERQALALMDHPNIARIYDGGVTTSGQPFFVMELVQGVPLTEYCDAKRLTVDARLQLFVQICQAVQHAHQKGIIHRDLKPANVLVTEVDGRPTPKVIDFGVAKATEQKLTDLSFSDVGAIVGTPAYMSPEQADPSSMDIDTRTDVYALGVMLYELLTGSPPIDSKQFKRGAILEMLRMVREVEPPRPSTRLSTADALPNIAANRNIEPARLAKLLQGELDWVVMKALEKDRTRRYETANGLARDVQRYLADEVVEARPPSAGYRFKKFVRRHKGQVIAASLIALALVGGIVGTSLGLVEANRAREAESNRAEGERVAKLDAQAKEQEASEERANAQAAARREKERADGEQQANEEAQRNLAFARKGNEILGSVFEGLDPKAKYTEVSDLRNALRDNLHNAIKQLEGSAIGSPLIVAEMQSRLGLSLLGLGVMDSAIEILKKAAETRTIHLGPDHLDTLSINTNLAEAYDQAGDLKMARQLYKESLKILKTKYGPNHPVTHANTNNLATMYLDSGELEEALPLLEDTLEFTKFRFGLDDPKTLSVMNNLAGYYLTARKLDKALPLMEKTLQLKETKLGLNHPSTLLTMNNLAGVYYEAGQIERATELFEKNLERTKVKLGHDHPDTLAAINNLAGVYAKAGKLERALPLFKDLLEIQKVRLPPSHPYTLGTMSNLAVVYERTGNLDLAIPLYVETLNLKTAKLGLVHPDTLVILENLAQAYLKAGKLELALPMIRESVMISRKLYPKDSRQLAGALSMAGSSFLPAKAFDEAATVLRESLAIREKAQPDAWNTFNTQSMLGAALLGQKKYADAEPLLLKGYEGMKSREKTIPPQGIVRIPEALDRLIELYTATKKPDEAKKYRELRAKYPPELAPMPKVKK